MKNIKRALALVLCMVLVCSYLPMNALAAGGEPNVYMSVDKTEVDIGDTITVSVNYTDMVVSSFACTLKFDKDLLECVSVVGCDPEYPEDIGLCTKRSFVPGTASSTPAEANGNGQVGFAYAGTKDATYLECTVFIATFTAKAAGTAEFALVEDSAGTDTYKGAAGSATVVIKGSEPEPPAHECTHGAVRYEVGENGQHTKIVACADPNCDKIYSSTVENCSGGKADCENAAVCEFCGNTYGEEKGHGKTNGFHYVHNDGTDTHNVICADCQKTVEEDVACTFENGSHVCKFACGNKTDCADNNNDHKCDVCGTELSECADKPGDNDHDCDICGKPDITECASVDSDHDCDECHKENVEGHTEATETETVTEADCENAATFRDIVYCTVCGKTLSTGEVYSFGDPLGHTWGTPAYNWNADSCTATRSCEAEGCQAPAQTETVTGTKSVTTPGSCQVEEVYVYVATFAAEWAEEQTSEPITGEKDMTNHTSTEFTYVDNGETHTKKNKCCGTEVETVPHTYIDGVCECEAIQMFTVTFTINGEPYGEPVQLKFGDTITAPDYTVPEGHTFSGWTLPETMPAENITLNATLTVNEYTLTIQYLDENGHWTTKNVKVPYGTNLAELDEIKNLQNVTVDNDTEKGLYEVTDHCAFGPDSNDLTGADLEGLTMPAYNAVIDIEYDFTGWYYIDDAWTYWVKNEIQKSGWTKIGDAWYYLDTESGARAEGLTRVPYNTALGHKNNESSTTYIDANEAWYYFAADGKYEITKNGIFDGRYVVNGMIPWHPGLVEVNDELYYFVGDKDNGGNKFANDDVLVTRLNDIAGYENRAVYNFVDGKFSGADGIVDGKYYQASKLMRGAGLVKVGQNYIYVRSNGEIVKDCKYWVTKNNGYCQSGMYTFDENGYLVTEKDVTTNGIVDGVYYKNGMPYYAGLIEIDGDMYYIRSNGQVATGLYYVTKVNNTGIEKGTKLNFGTDGKLIPAKNGIYEENGGYYYYVNNVIQKGIGVVQLTDENGEIFYIYVRSNGQLATGLYWPTVRNELLSRGVYNWGSDGRYYPN